MFFKKGILSCARAAFFGFVGATALIHITPIALSIIRNFENGYFSQRHDEFETATLLIVCFLTLIMEPVTYIVNFAVSLEKSGFTAFLWLAPVAVTQAYAFIRWLLKKDRTLPQC